MNFGVEAWDDLNDRFFTPPRPGLEDAYVRATELGRDALREAKRDGLRLGTQTQRSAFLRRPEEVQRLWEALAPAAWVGDSERGFCSVWPGSDSPTDRSTYPDLPEDVVALVADPAGVLRCESLARESVARARAVGWSATAGPPVWWSVPRDHRRNLLLHRGQPWYDSKIFRFLFRKVPRLTDRAIREARTRFEPEWARSRRGRFEFLHAALMFGRMAVEGYAAWDTAARSGRGIGLDPNDASARSAEVSGRPVRDFKNPFEPFVQALLIGYVIADSDAAATHLLFPRLEGPAPAIKRSR